MAKTNANEAAELRQKLARTTESLHVTQNQLNAKELEVQNADRNAALRLQEMVRLRIKNSTCFFGTFLSWVDSLTLLQIPPDKTNKQ